MASWRNDFGLLDLVLELEHFLAISLLFLDEPTGALDEETGRKILDYIWKLKEKLGFTLIMVTHNQNIADMARTIIRVNSGKITQVVTNDQPQTAYEIGW